MWNITLLDIEKTLSNVVHRVTNDHSIDDTTRAKRNEALILLGEVFSAYGIEVEVGLAEFKIKMQDQFAAAERAQAATNESAESKSSGRNTNSTYSNTGNSTSSGGDVPGNNNKAPLNKQPSGDLD